MDDERIPQEVEDEVAAHLGLPAWGIKLYVSEKQNRWEIRPHGGADFPVFEAFVPPDWLERKYKAGIWRGYSCFEAPVLVVQFGWGNERSNGRQGFANVKALRYLKRGEGYDPPHLMVLCDSRFGLHCLGATYMSDSSFDDCWQTAERHAAEKLGVKL